ncbi:MAG: hypothetical protein GDA56_02815 [Hormoscilla sp. GM7CHS1pb]|nr:hypothetical protein [Hormoscilla sp. GM7CHS1pb]
MLKSRNQVLGKNLVSWLLAVTASEYGRSKMICSQLGKAANRYHGIVEYVIIEEKTIRPTNDQGQSCLRVCQMLSNCYRDIKLFRFSEITGDVYILAGDELQIVVPPNVIWRFIDET